MIPILQDLGLKKTRVAKWNRSVKKALGTNKSLYVISTKGTEKSNMEALCIGLDMGFGEDRYKKKMNHGKFTLIFAKDDIDNLSDETE